MRAEVLLIWYSTKHKHDFPLLTVNRISAQPAASAGARMNPARVLPSSCDGSSKASIAPKVSRPAIPLFAKPDSVRKFMRWPMYGVLFSPLPISANLPVLTSLLSSVNGNEMTLSAAAIILES